MAKILRIALGVALLALVALIVVFNVLNFGEAFGSGPPYYGRTTNMDKWSNPLPVLAAVDALGILAIAAYMYFMKRKG
ncbi:hypothetical protein SAMN05443245_5679 [Paraburkholderia fungorum]|uniref:Uncharacterized protein n=1 Tax=Paraburkholderia fungorum TaxID=134537 RepID=A0A1H1IU23_9BURK|nr:hypothetical protein [Paraburkholderia fungorum]SDR41207.1 hypothetical protein SAMN05443245_5679 [Paraburkholderia fungorum]